MSAVSASGASKHAEKASRTTPNRVFTSLNLCSLRAVTAGLIVCAVTSNPSRVTRAPTHSFVFPVGTRLAAVIVVLAVAACGGTSGVASHNSPSASAGASIAPSESPSPSPSPTPTPGPTPTPVTVPSWAAMHATCSGAPATQEALINLQGATHPVLADVTDPTHPRTICNITRPCSPQTAPQRHAPRAPPNGP